MCTLGLVNASAQTGGAIMFTQWSRIGLGLDMLGVTCSPPSPSTIGAAITFTTLPWPVEKTKKRIHI